MRMKFDFSSWPRTGAALAALGLAVGVALAAGCLFTPAEAQEGIRTTSDPCFWDNLDWDELSSSEQKAWMALGWTAAAWDSDDENDTSLPDSDYKVWDEFTVREKAALQALGYDRELWNKFDSAECP
ncbi:MAG TPA: hypothetical protein VH933_01170 [Aestuariivirgaceae bacterium]